ncbi:MAG TPA: alpha/beta fold hydrolase [Actinomycetota bacterium]|nr:alpha/beta fold hydrolase [Actinomycetota bacterium]
MDPGPGLHVETHGEGRPLLLICGTGMDVTTWSLFHDWLADGRRAIAFDNRDCGRSELAAGPYTVADLAVDAAAVAEAHADGPVDVLGLSLGGAIAQELAVARPELVRSLVLLNTWGRTDRWLREKFETKIAQVQRLTRAEYVHASAFDLFSHRFFDAPGLLDAYLEMTREPYHPQPVEAAVRQWRADQGHDALDRLARVASPTLVLGGAEDTLTPARYSVELAEALPGARLEILPEAGHGMILERRGEVRDAVVGFLADVG